MSGKHARRRPRWFYLALGVITALVTSMALFLAPAGTAGAANVFPSQDACHVTDNNTPVGNCGPFHQLYRDSFNPGGVVASVPLGAFSSCGGDGDYQCTGLKAKYGHYYSTLGAYPNGWPDTATSGADNNGGQDFGGYYRPQDTISVTSSSTGDGSHWTVCPCPSQV